MAEFFEIVASVSVLVFVVSCMAAAGLGLAVRDIVAPLRIRLVLLALALNFALAPTLAWGLSKLFALDAPYAIGLILLGAAAGAPFLAKLSELAKGDVAFSVGLMLLLTVATVIFLPIALPFLIPGQSVDAWPILRSLLATMLLPLGIGMTIRARSERWSLRLRSVFMPISNVSMILAVVLLIALNFEAIIATFGSGAALVAVLFVAILVAAGHLCGGPSGTTRSVLALGTGQRNIAAALIVATQNALDAKVVVMLLISTLAGLVVSAPAAKWFARPRLGVAAMVAEPIRAGGDPMNTNVLVSDFDGTMTRHDFYKLVIESLLPPDTPDYWSEYRSGRITHFEALRLYFAAIRATEKEVLAVVERMELDPNLPAAIAALRRDGWNVIVTSAGCDWYIQRLLKGAGVDVEVHSNPGRFVEGKGLLMEMPKDSPFLSLNLGVDKAAVVKRQIDDGRTVAFAGDGFPDAEPARLVPPERRFARGDLVKVMSNEGRPFHPFETWSDIARILVPGGF